MTVSGGAGRLFAPSRPTAMERSAHTSGQGEQSAGRHIIGAGHDDAVARIFEQLNPYEVLSPGVRVGAVHVAQILDEHAVIEIAEIRMPRPDARGHRRLNRRFGKSCPHEPQTQKGLAR